MVETILIPSFDDLDIMIPSCADGEVEREPNSFWRDFSIADAFGTKGIRDTYKRAFGEWRGNYKMLTELVMVLNHKIWQHYGNGNMEYADLYNDLWSEADKWAMENLKGDEIKFFLSVTD